MGNDNKNKKGNDFKMNPYGHPTKGLSPSTTSRRNSKDEKQNDLEDKNRKKRTKSSKSQKKLKKPNKAKKDDSKQKERDRWKRGREQRRYHEDKKDVINSSAKVRKFFGDDPKK